MTQKINLSDYKQPDFWAETVDLDFNIQKDHTIVTNRTLYKKNESTEGFELTLNGVDLEVIEFKIDEIDKEFELKDDKIHLTELPTKFTLTTKVKIKPDENLTGEGLYRSGKIFCTQCEAEGFRRITLHPDRSDVMSSYTVRIEGDKKEFPYLLSNGDMTDSGDLENNRHFAFWHDPHKKPSYLFALVAGDLEKITDTFTTKSGRKVSLEFFVDHGNGDKVDHAMESLKNSMKWDEDRFGLEYDLDTYMVVAVDSFNMGAMENKGLNIFNSAYVLAKPETATDRDFQGIEGVIGHEYFHNWTGNRVTCRDWFQLTLKEGLTVFRDQEFSADMNSRPVKRIDDVQVLQAHQFPEDEGPLSHPIKPKSYLEISNFYTATVYEKGAEVIRMIHTLLGEEKFRAGMDLYFERHDGQAVTTEEFVAAMADASGIDLNRFKNWYDQNGTPEVTITTNLEKNGKFHVLFTHETKFNNKDSSLHFPFHFSLYNKQGKLIYTDKDFEIKENPQTLIIEGISEEPIPSWNEGFCAPVKFKTNYSFEELAVMMANCQDAFNQYEFAQLAIQKQIDVLIKHSKKEEELTCDESFLKAYHALLRDQEKDKNLLAYALSIPSIKEFNDKQEQFDFVHVPKALKFLKTTLATHFKDELISVVSSLHEEGSYSPDPVSIGKRALKFHCLGLLSELDESYEIIKGYFDQANNMTDEIGTLSLLAKRENSYRTEALNKFYTKWKHETLVMQKWLAIQAKAEDVSIEKLQQLEQVDIYDEKVPNLVRSVYGRFVALNVMNLHEESGAVYDFICKKLTHIDSYNPQIAARLAKSLSVLKKLDPARRELLRGAMLEMKGTGKLSKDTFEVVNSNFEG